MALTSLPPQAYTRDTLVKAIEWMSAQPPSLREKATSADLMVSFYLQARRRVAAQMEAPISGEVFKADLRHLAEDLKQFEDPLPPPQSAGVGRSLSQSYEDPAATETIFNPPRFNRTEFGPRPVPPPEPPPLPRAFQWTVDARSLGLAREIQKRLNLSGEGEALRLLIALGAERAQNF